MLQFDNAGALDHRYLYGPAVDQILTDEGVTSTSSPGTNLWDLTDHLGTVRDLVNNSGTVQNHITYTSFGKVATESAPTVDHLFGFTGRERDEESGLQFNRARYYDPAVGRWISMDPLGFLGGDPNPQRFVGNRPSDRVDPSGLFTWELGPTGKVIAVAEEGDTYEKFVQQGYPSQAIEKISKQAGVGMEEPIAPGTEIDLTPAFPPVVEEVLEEQQTTPVEAVMAALEIGMKEQLQAGDTVGAAGASLPLNRPGEDQDEDGNPDPGTGPPAYVGC